MYRRVFLSLILSCIACTCGSCSPMNDKPIALEAPVWIKGDTWKVKAMTFSTSGRDGRRHETGRYATLRFEVVDNEEVYGEPCHVLKITPADDTKYNYPGDTFEMWAYYSTKDLSLKRIRERSWTEGKLSEYDEHSPPGKSLLSFQVGTPFDVPLDMPPFPIREDSQPRELVRYDLKANAKVAASGDEDKVVESSIIATAAAEADSGAQGLSGKQASLPVFKVNFLTRDIYSKSGQHDKIHVEETWKGGNKWWTSATNISDVSRIVGKWSLVEESEGSKTGGAEGK